MPEPITANNNGQADPSAPPPGNNGSGEPVPFHIDPKVQDYIARQVDNKVADKEATLRADYEAKLKALESKALPASAPTKDLSDIEIAVSEVSKKYEVNTELVKDIMENSVRVVEARTEKRSVAERKQQNEIAERFGEVFKTNPDAIPLQPKMLEIMKGLSEVERTFVVSSISGATWLYERAKRATVVPVVPSNGGSSLPDGGLNPAKNFNGNDSVYTRAIAALQAGRKAEYESLMASTKR